METITAKASYNTSLYNSKNSTYQIFILKDVLNKMRCAENKNLPCLKGQKT